MTEALQRWCAGFWLVLAALLPVAAAFAEPSASAAAQPAGTATLRYRAYLAGAPVGEATVDVTVQDGRYRVEGDAASTGWVQGVTRWRNRFAAHGRLAGQEKEPAEFAYTETDRDKHRHVVVRDGTLQVTKNGKERPPRSSPGGADVVSALFVQPDCLDDQVIHTGRHAYRLKRLGADGDGCRYSVTDDDDDTFEIDLDLARHGDLVVPRRITVRAWVTGWVELTDEAPLTELSQQ